MGAGRRVIVLYLFTFMYLFIGASIFSAIESAHEEKIKLDLHNHLESFMERHPCLNVSEFRDVLSEVWYAASIGVEKMTGQNNDTSPSSRWDLANAFFFSTTVITTIGYGHLSPATSTGQNFCIAYAYFGIPLMAILLSEISSKWKQRLLNLGQYLNTHLANTLKHNRVRRMAITIILVIPAYVIVVIIPAIVFSYIEGWDFLTAHYYCFISLSTIGLGDYVATQNDYENKALVWVYKIGMSLYLITGLGIVALVFHGVQTKKRKPSHQSFSKRFVNILRKRKKPWLQMMEEQAEMMVDGFPVDAGVISSTVAAAAVAAGVSNTKQEKKDTLEDDDHVDSCRFLSDNEDMDDDLLEEESVDDPLPFPHYFLDQEKSTDKNRGNERKPFDFLDPADEEEAAFVFQSVIADRHASISIDPDSEGTDEEPHHEKPNNDHNRKPLRKASLSLHQFIPNNMGATKKTDSRKPSLSCVQSESPSQTDQHSDAKIEAAGIAPKKKLWSPSNSFTAEDSGIHAASSQSTIEMESTV